MRDSGRLFWIRGEAPIARCGDGSGCSANASPPPRTNPALAAHPLPSSHQDHRPAGIFIAIQIFRFLWVSGFHRAMFRLGFLTAEFLNASGFSNLGSIHAGRMEAVHPSGQFEILKNRWKA